VVKSMPSVTSNIRVFVHFRETTVFAGDEVACTITFKNLDTLEARPRPDRTSQQRNEHVPRHLGESSRASRVPSRPHLSRSLSPTTQEWTRQKFDQKKHPNHLPEVVNKPSQPQLPSRSNGDVQDSESATHHKHGRSVSIISLGVEAGNQSRGTDSFKSPNSPELSHARSASLKNAPTLGRPHHRSPSLGMSGPGDLVMLCCTLTEFIVQVVTTLLATVYL